MAATAATLQLLDDDRFDGGLAPVWLRGPR
jgi:hypothetical protein